MTGRIATASWFAYRPDMGLAVRASIGTPKQLAVMPDPLEYLHAATPRHAYFRAPDAEFDRAFLAQLNEYGVEGITERIERMLRKHGAETAVLLCFEEDAQNCHRGMFAKWWEEQTGEKVPDLGYRKPEPKAAEPDDQTLF